MQSKAPEVPYIMYSIALGCIYSTEYFFLFSNTQPFSSLIKYMDNERGQISHSEMFTRSVMQGKSRTNKLRSFFPYFKNENK